MAEADTAQNLLRYSELSCTVITVSLVSSAQSVFIAADKMLYEQSEFGINERGERSS